MFGEINNSNARFRLRDSNQNGWKFTFHILDHVGYQNNPRRRTLGLMQSMMNILIFRIKNLEMK